jgi:hypothetical protein
MWLARKFLIDVVDGKCSPRICYGAEHPSIEAFLRLTPTTADLNIMPLLHIILSPLSIDCCQCSSLSDRGCSYLVSS